MKHTTYSVSAAGNAEDRLHTAGLLTLSVLVVVQVLGRDTLSTSLSVALYCLAPSIPLLTLHLLANYADSKVETTVDPWYVWVPAMASYGLSLIALVALFWHFSWVHGLLCAVFIVLAFVAYYLHGELLSQVNQQSAEPSESNTTVKEPPVDA